MTDVVVGAGLAGLVAARTLADRGRDVTVFERRETVGGRVRTRDVDGFTLDRGFQVVFTAYPAVRRELDLDALELGAFTPGATLVRPGERSTLSDPLRDPSSLSASLFNREVTFGDKIRVLKLRRELTGQSVDAALRNDTETIAEYLAGKGFSERFRENFAAPFYGGITLDRSLSTSRAVFEYTFKMLTEGKTAIPADGMGAIPAQLAESARRVGATVVTGAAGESVDADGDGATVDTPAETVSADTVIVATDPPTARELTGVESIPTEALGCVTQHFALPETQRLDTGSRLLLNAADGRPNTVAPMSAASGSYAPDGQQLLSATFLGRQDADDGELAGEVEAALSSWYPENQFSDLDVLATDRIDFAQYPQRPGFRRELPDVDDPEGPVYLAGDYTSWSSIQGAMESGRAAARAVVNG
jgi:phytoene dehydrogenase-like protein